VPTAAHKNVRSRGEVVSVKGKDSISYTPSGMWITVISVVIIDSRLYKETVLLAFGM
jgi:hypothetical protein